MAFITKFFEKLFSDQREIPKKQVMGKVPWMGRDLMDSLLEDAERDGVIIIKKNGRVSLSRAFDILK